MVLASLSLVALLVAGPPVTPGASQGPVTHANQPQAASDGLAPEPDPESAAPQETRRPTRVRKGSVAPAANSSVEVIGADSSARATMDRPLLPIASLGNNLGIRSGTAIQVRLKRTVDSGHAHNGDTLDATLAHALGKLPVGTPVRLTVVQASPAGALLSSGELSIQVVSIGAQAILSDTISAQGHEGKKELADSAPAVGTEAVFTADQVISLPAA